jgi:hypothetical protein
VFDILAKSRTTFTTVSGRVLIASPVPCEGAGEVVAVRVDVWAVGGVVDAKREGASHSCAWPSLARDDPVDNTSASPFEPAAIPAEFGKCALSSLANTVVGGGLVRDHRPRPRPAAEDERDASAAGHAAI